MARPNRRRQQRRRRGGGTGERRHHDGHPMRQFVRIGDDRLAAVCECNWQSYPMESRQLGYAAHRQHRHDTIRRDQDD